jgi:hypothetical protein
LGKGRKQREPLWFGYKIALKIHALMVDLFLADGMIEK